MTSIPRVAILKPDPSIDPRFLEIFQRHEYGLRLVENITEIIDLIADEGSDFDAIAIPLQLIGGMSGISTCLQVKATPALSSTPVVAFCTVDDKMAVQSFYQAGADVVLLPLFDPDIVHAQICSLQRMKRAFDERLAHQFESSGLMHPVVTAFDSVREGLLLFSNSHRLMHANRAACYMLGVRDKSHDKDFAQVSAQFIFFLKEHEVTTRTRVNENGKQTAWTNFDASVVRLDGQAFNALLTITSIEHDPNQPIGFSLSMTDASEIQHLANTLVQSQRIRSLCLTAMAACNRFLESSQGSLVIAPMKQLTQVLSQTQPSAPLNACLTSLLECIDVVSNEGVAVRVKMDKDLVLGVRPPDLFQLLGHMLLHAIEHAGTSGDVTIETSDYLPGEGAIITVSSLSRKVTPFVPEDKISHLIRSDFATLMESKQAPAKLQHGLHLAQQIARQYRAVIEYQEPNWSLIRLRVKLPVLQRSGK